MDNPKDHSTDQSKKKRKRKKPNQPKSDSSQATNIPSAPDNTNTSILNASNIIDLPQISGSTCVNKSSVANLSPVQCLVEPKVNAMVSSPKKTTGENLNLKEGGANSGPVKKKKGANKPIEAATAAPATRSSANPAPLFQWSRKENNLNLAVEENHTNLVVETNSRIQQLPLSNTVNVANNYLPTCNGVMSDTVLKSPPATETAAMQSNDTENSSQPKTKAQLKAERKAAFEAEKAAQIASQKEVKQQKSKTDLKAERRAIQEAQRAQKLGQSEDTGQPAKISDLQSPASGSQATNTGLGKTTTKTGAPKKTISLNLKVKSNSPEKQPSKPPQRKFRLFSHLPQHVWSPEITSRLGMASCELHPSVIRAGLRMAQGYVRGSNARCVASLAALRDVITDYTTPPQKELSRELDAIITQHVGFLKKCRPLAASTANAVKRLKWEVTQIDSSFNDHKAKEKLKLAIDTFIEEDIIIAKRSISEIAGKKIKNDDVILTYACSSLVKQVLSDAHASGKKFRVIVVDSRPGFEGCEMLGYLVDKGICCTYVWINAVSYVIKEVTKVILGCHSLQANGYVMSRVGSSQVALVAHSNNVPVLVCCETYKFCERVHTDSFICNELGDSDKLVSTTPTHKSHLGDWKSILSLNVVSLTYDVMPAHLVTSVITELEMLPCTSVPVVLRVKHVATHEVHNEKQRLAYG